ncbi:MAG: hypothetical protein PHT02_09940 [Tissierellia bacterium]|nr:hypothetical protein [Tissierellia bacterium]
MSKGNGRRFMGKGNGMDNFNGTCNGGSAKTHEENLFDPGKNQNKPSSNEFKASNNTYNKQLNSLIRDFKKKTK